MQMRESDLMTWISLEHIVIGLLLLLPSTRFAAGVMHLVLSLGIVFFHVTLLPEGLGPAIGMLVLNLGVVAYPAGWGAMMRAPTARHS